MGTISPVARLHVLGELMTRPQTVRPYDWNLSSIYDVVAHHLVSSRRLILSYPLPGVGHQDHWLVVRSLLELVGSDDVRTPPHVAG